ncbi:hypothetical protein ACIQNU_38875 [Streptomyces sp. NPDC091292]|uniref:hypothetical protein n=1 Tax=Streptomyces sp. NPDC091292 TaxID=3365991 RepID=UPI00382F8FE4
MATVTHRFSGRMSLAANSQQWFGFVYTDTDVVQPRSFNRWAVGNTGFGGASTYLDITQELSRWDISATPHNGWNLLIRTQGDDADFIVSAVNIDQ